MQRIFKENHTPSLEKQIALDLVQVTQTITIKFSVLNLYIKQRALFQRVPNDNFHCGFQVRLALHVLLHNFRFQAGGCMFSAYVVYVFMKTSCSTVPIRIRRHTDLFNCTAN